MLITIAQRGQTRNLEKISMEAAVPWCKSRNRARNPFSGHYDALLGLCSQMCLESLQDWLLEPCRVQNPNDWTYDLNPISFKGRNGSAGCKSKRKPPLTQNLFVRKYIQTFMFRTQESGLVIFFGRKKNLFLIPEENRNILSGTRGHRDFSLDSMGQV